MKLAPLTLLFVCATPAYADVSAKLPPTWRDACALRLDAAAAAAGMTGHARRDSLPLVKEDGSPNPMQLVEFGDPSSRLTAMIGNEDQRQPDKPWTATDRHGHSRTFVEWFRRSHGIFAKLTLANPAPLELFKSALDECLKMGEAK